MLHMVPGQVPVAHILANCQMNRSALAKRGHHMRALSYNWRKYGACSWI